MPATDPHWHKPMQELASFNLEGMNKQVDAASRNHSGNKSGIQKRPGVP
jgi:hypothetical protein